MQTVLETSLLHSVFLNPLLQKRGGLPGNAISTCRQEVFLFIHSFIAAGTGMG